MMNKKKVDSQISEPEIDEAFIAAQASTENFPVALKVLPKKYRQKLSAFYSYARLVDDLGDEYSGDRLKVLDWAQQQLSSPTNSIFVKLDKALGGIKEGSHIYEALVKLIDANRLDQTKHRYASHQELEDYCALSANPVGHIVLYIFGVDSFELRQHSDSVCVGLQILEHLQDIGEDLTEKERIYLPATELEKYGVTEEGIGNSQSAGKASPELCDLVLANLKRVTQALQAGRPLVKGVKGFWGKLAINAYVSGGLAHTEALKSVGGDIFHPKAQKINKPKLLFRIIVLRGK